MDELLYENQKRLRDQDLHGYVERLGLDVDSFDRELAQHVHAARVHEDFMSGVRSGVNGTPSFYIDGVRHDDSQTSRPCSPRWSKLRGAGTRGAMKDCSELSADPGRPPRRPECEDL
jgi:hypothetical protein